MGVVTLLSGQPKEAVSVEARAESKGLYEETVTDSTGFYRLRGLLPDTTYVIKVARKVASGGAMIERASPESLTVQVGILHVVSFRFMFMSRSKTRYIHCDSYYMFLPWFSL